MFRAVGEDDDDVLVRGSFSCDEVDSFDVIDGVAIVVLIGVCVRLGLKRKVVGIFVPFFVVGNAACRRLTFLMQGVRWGGWF